MEKTKEINDKIELSAVEDEENTTLDDAELDEASGGFTTSPKARIVPGQTFMA